MKNQQEKRRRIIIEEHPQVVAITQQLHVVLTNGFLGGRREFTYP